MTPTCITYLPPNLKEAPSDCIKSDCIKSEHKATFLKTVDECPLYAHWFAMKVVEMSTSIDTSAEVIQTELNGITSTISKDGLKILCQRLRSMTKMRTTKTGYYFKGACKEGVYTSLISTWFQDFLGSNSLRCFHNFPCGSSLSAYKSDLQIVNHTDDMHTILVNAYKPHSLSKATIETHAYAVDVFQHISDQCSVILGLPMTLQTISLYVYFSYNEKLMAIKIMDVEIMDDTTLELEKFLCVIYAAVHSLAKNPITTSSPTAITVNCCAGDHHVLSANCVLCENQDVITKMYDVIHKPYLKPNLKLIQADNPTLEHFCNERIAYLKYKYIHGSHKPRNLASILDVIRSLKKIHETGYVHGDIRVSNIVYGSHTDSGTIIDCDFASTEGAEYPQCFSSDVAERAAGAKKLNPMKQSHDRESLFKAICDSYIYMTPYQCSHLQSLTMKNKPLDVIISQLQEDTEYY